MLRQSKLDLNVSMSNVWHIALIDRMLCSLFILTFTSQQIAVYVYSPFLSFSASTCISTTLYWSIQTTCTYIYFWNSATEKGSFDRSNYGAVVGSKKVGAEEIIFINPDFTPTHYSSICFIPHLMLTMRWTIHPLSLPSLAFNPTCSCMLIHVHPSP